MKNRNTQTFANSGFVEDLGEKSTENGAGRLPFEIIEDEKIEMENENKVTINVRYDDPDDAVDAYSRKNNFFGKMILAPRRRIHKILKKPKVKSFTMILMLAVFLAYIIAAMILRSPFKFPEGVDRKMFISNYIFSSNTTLALFSLTIIALLLFIWDKLIIRYIGSFNARLKSKKISKRLQLCKPYFSWIITIAVFTCCVSYVLIDMEDYGNLKSLVGIFFFLSLCCICSYYPSDIHWRCLIAGISIQIILGILCLRTRFGYELFKFLGDQMIIFLYYTDYGTSLVFGELANDHYFAMRAMPIALFFGGVVNVLYYWGALQYVILKFSWVMNKIMGTSPTESMISVASIFLGQAEAPILVRPFLDDMTISELFAVMLAGFSTVAGSTMAAYTGFGVEANHLLIASLMSAPASLALSKVVYPEIAVTKADWNSVKNLPKGEEKNMIQAFSIGANNMIKPISCVITNLIAFRALLQFFEATVLWLMSNLNLHDIGLVRIIQYPFSLLALIMGFDNEDSMVVGNLLAKKIFVSEFISYQELGVAINFRKAIIANGTFDLYRNGSIPVPSDISMIWNEKSAVMSTYALCGFASFASIGICIGGMSALAPSRSKVFARLAALAMVFGNITSFFTACFAGILETSAP